MKNKTGSNNQFKAIANILLVVVLLYPILFSFTHALTHHHEEHEHKTNHCCQYEYKHIDKDDLSDELLSSISEECPICNYEFALAIKTERQLLSSINFNKSQYDFPLSELIIVSDLCQITAPRAPPTHS